MTDYFFKVKSLHPDIHSTSLILAYPESANNSSELQVLLATNRGLFKPWFLTIPK